MIPAMHCQEELEIMLSQRKDGFITDESLLGMFNDQYSTSKHLLTLYLIARGLSAQTIVEVGFGRSSFVLARAARETGGHFFTCDHRDFSYLLSPEERIYTTYIHGKSDSLWDALETRNSGIGFAFLDYFSNPDLDIKYCIDEIVKCLSRVKENGIVAIHDTYDGRYSMKEAIASLQAKFNMMTLPYNYGLTLFRRSWESEFGCIPDAHHKKGG